MAPAEVHGSQVINEHTEPHEMHCGSGVYELGDGRELPAHETGRSLCDEDKELPNLPSPMSPVSPTDQ